MKMRRAIKAGGITIATFALATGAGWFVVGAHSVHAAGSTPKAIGAAAPVRVAMPLGLPSEEAAKMTLSASLVRHHPQWLEVPMGAVKILVFIIYPDLAGTAPVAVITARNQGMSDWVRAVGTEVVNEGFITVVGAPI
jgi:hypothetical protein